MLWSYGQCFSQAYQHRLTSFASYLTHCSQRDATYFECIHFKHNVWIDIQNIQAFITLEWMPEDLVHEESKLIEVMAWCHQVVSHNPDLCWPIFPARYGDTRPQWVKWLIACCIFFNNPFLENIDLALKRSQFAIFKGNFFKIGYLDMLLCFGKENIINYTRLSLILSRVAPLPTALSYNYIYISYISIVYFGIISGWRIEHDLIIKSLRPIWNQQ